VGIGWCWNKFEALGKDAFQWWCWFMVGEIYYEVVIGVSLDLLTIVFLVTVFSMGSSVWLFMEERFYCFPFMNML
jgi:hypothetical protein